SLAFTQQPLTGQSQVPFGPPVAVRAQDAFGNAVADGTPITLTALGAGAALGGPTTVATAGGLTTFTGLLRGGSGLNDTLRASAGRVTAVSLPYTSVLISHVLPAVVAVDIYGPHPNASADEAFVRGLYRIVLDRDAAPAEVAVYIQALHAGLVTRPTMIDNF